MNYSRLMISKWRLQLAAEIMWFNTSRLFCLELRDWNYLSFHFPSGVKANIFPHALKSCVPEQYLHAYSWFCLLNNLLVIPTAVPGQVNCSLTASFASLSDISSDFISLWQRTQSTFTRFSYARLFSSTPIIIHSIKQLSPWLLSPGQAHSVLSFEEITTRGFVSSHV